MHDAINAFLLGFPALFSIVNPPSTAFIFHQVVADRAARQRNELARRVALFSFIVIMVALWAGSYLLAFFGITLAALRLAAWCRPGRLGPAQCAGAARSAQAGASSPSRRR